ncbi:MAG TPA: alpha/beta hydrolase [Syntrophomonas sp.]|nr:alpha/beta hydrolase [Syntrophomonas sp.]
MNLLATPVSAVQTTRKITILLLGLLLMLMPMELFPSSEEKPSQEYWSDIPYADLSSNQKLDISLPSGGKAPFPVIVSIHGGKFISGDKRSPCAPPIRGYAVVSINYRLLSEVDSLIPIVHDVKAAIRWIRANAKTYYLDPNRIAIWGESSGGYLASMVGTTAGVKGMEDLSLGNPDQSSKVLAVVDWFGPTYAKEPLVSPESYISSDDPPFYIQHGTKDGAIPVKESIDFSKKLQQVLGKDKVVLDLIKGGTHVGPEFFEMKNYNKILDFLDKYMK